jgi:hypothetical protein
VVAGQDQDQAVALAVDLRRITSILSHSGTTCLSFQFECTGDITGPGSTQIDSAYAFNLKWFCPWLALARVRLTRGDGHHVPIRSTAGRP